MCGFSGEEEWVPMEGALLWTSGSQLGAVLPTPTPHTQGTFDNVWRHFWLSQFIEFPGGNSLQYSGFFFLVFLS